MKKAVFIGSVDFSNTLLNVVLASDKIDLVGIISKESSGYNSDFQSLIPIANAYNIPFHDFKNNEEMYSWIKNINFDVIFCFGWSHLIKKELIELAGGNIWGYHPAALPQNRGRHPIIWALALGLESTASTFFKIDEGADSGDIISQKVVEILNEDNAESLYEKLKGVAVKQLSKAIDQFADDNLQYVAQDHSSATYWRKRSKEDGIIDWRMTNESIYNLIRALYRPYPGAIFTYRDNDVIVWKSKISNLGDENIEPGKVIAFNGHKPIVKCGKGSIILQETSVKIDFEIGDYLI